MAKPEWIAGNLFLFTRWNGGLTLSYARLFAGGIGLGVFFLLHHILTHTRTGLVIRAGTENRDMTETLGYRTSLLFVGLFIAANLLASLGGTLYALNLGSVSTEISNDLLLLVIAAIMIGGKGSIRGCLTGSVLVMLSQNYMNGIYPPLGGEFTAVLLMLGVLLWRPQGLDPWDA
jgi:branched-chain amino acid transport system permease protein